jgi:hypothetical protein
MADKLINELPESSTFDGFFPFQRTGSNFANKGSFAKFLEYIKSILAITSVADFRGVAYPDGSTSPTVPTTSSSPQIWIGGPGTYTAFDGVEITGAVGFIAGQAGAWAVQNIDIDLSGYATNDELNNYVSKYSFENVSGAIPVSATPLDLGTAQDGFYRTTDFGSDQKGDFTASANYSSYVFTIDPAYIGFIVTGTIQDSGTALAFYYDAEGSFISFEFQGTTAAVNYTNQRLTIPSNATTLKLTFLNAGLLPSVSALKFASDLLTESVGDGRYLGTDAAQASYVPLTLMPSQPSSTKELSFNSPDLSGLTTSGGDTNTEFYVLKAHQIQKAGTILKRVSFKTTGATQITIAVFTINDDGNTISVSRGIAFDSISVASGVNEYLIDSYYILPKGCYLGVLCTNTTLTYKNGAANSSYRIHNGSATGTASAVNIGFNFTTSDSEPVLDPILTQEQAATLYQPLNGINAGDLPIAYPKQVKLQLTSTSKIMLYGDSRSSTDYTWYQSSMQALTGAQVYNGGFSGYTAQQLAMDAQLQRLFNYDPQLIIALIEGNNDGAAGSVGTFGAVNGEPTATETDITQDFNATTYPYFIQAVSHMMRKIKAHYYNIRQRANLTGSETETEKDAKIAAVNNPYIVFCNGWPQQRIDSSNSFSQPANWQRKRNAIVECANRYKIHCIDTMNLVGWDMSLEPYWPGVTDKATNYGIYTMDGLHENQFGAMAHSQIVCGGIGII